ncbi:MAG TPA: DEAD/DEAH box helicase [Cyclobacteriaceae bacterium]|nr:DEAD/DEAH box helicase [Cyclobacteriaceae bacterium]HMV07998.1 DEAD/DEAH box helicase [Cyclobacteriaceae bacterium]HMW99132.1 DEAD/DEAH box helicase [Cyclobacteriaceae bacterium]HMX48235.1 DEAD/DEAH box helicase [Cyclobacteriaceae bacterium]HMY95040.1 DEAD/DEAH box helicase [Cyclobacteriaceae bacterium]
MKEAATFEQFNLNRQLLDAVHDAGFSEPTDIQQKAIPIILGGQQVIGIAQTGTGKTAAYLLPLLMKVKYAQGNDPRAIVLVPTKELTLQITEHAKSFAKNTDLRILPIYGGVGIKTQIEAIQKGVDILIATPGRFMELYLTNELPVKQIKTLVIDEADRMMDMGFMPQLRKIFDVIPRKRQNLLFSATFPEKVERLSGDFLEFPVKIEVTPQATPARQVSQVMYRVPNLKTKINFIEYLLQNRETFNRVMIFTRTKANADAVSKYLDRKGLGPVKVIHSNKSQNTRINAVNEFKQGNLRVLVTTDVTARGIDVTKVSHVINFDVPILYEDYVHRIGRTGRAFQEGSAITFVNKAEEYHIQKIEKLIREKIREEKIPAEVEITKTSFEESQQMAREIDQQKRRDDPTFKGAFHDKKNSQ